jgi:hypothetical protein
MEKINNKLHVNILPPELWELVLCHGNTWNSFKQISLVCKFWCELLKSPTFRVKWLLHYTNWNIIYCIRICVRNKWVRSLDILCGEKYQARITNRKAYNDILIYAICQYFPRGENFKITKQTDQKSNNAFYEIFKILVGKVGAEAFALHSFSLRRAAFHNSMAIVSFFVEKGADPSAKNFNSVETSAYRGHENVTKYLLNFGGYEAALRGACKSGNVDIIDRLLASDISSLRRTCLFAINS